MSRSVSRPSSLFVTPKSRGAIPVGCELRHDALRLLALDSEVGRIEYVSSTVFDLHVIPLDCLLVDRTGRRELVEVVTREGLLRDLDAEGLHLLACRALSATPVRMCRRDIEREPRVRNAREVWAEHERRVSLGARLKIAEALVTMGPVGLDRLCSRIGRGARHDVFALACQAAITIDLLGDLAEARVTAGTSYSATCGARP